MIKGFVYVLCSWVIYWLDTVIIDEMSVVMGVVFILSVLAIANFVEGFIKLYNTNEINSDIEIIM